MDKNAKIYVAGHRGLVGSALMRQLQAQGYVNIVFRTHAELDLTNQQAVSDFFKTEKPEYVFLAAAKVGGIHANNTYPATFIHENLSIQSNVIHQSYLNGIKRLLFLGSSCIYPRDCPQPIKEEYLLTGPLEPTNRPYALAKIAGIEMCWSYNRQYGTQYLAVMPTNLFGFDDHYDLNNSHVLPALLRKFHLAKLASKGDWLAIEADEKCYGILTASYREKLQEACKEKKTIDVEVWGTGQPRREFLFNEDMANACIYLINLPDEEYKAITGWNRNNGLAPVINIGTGKDISIYELAVTIAEVVGFDGGITFDPSKPDGTPQKLMSITQITSLGWAQPFVFKSRLEQTYQSYLTETLLRSRIE